jgi:hypothetical protein
MVGLAALAVTPFRDGGQLAAASTPLRLQWRRRSSRLEVDMAAAEKDAPVGRHSLTRCMLMEGGGGAMLGVWEQQLSM